MTKSKKEPFSKNVNILEFYKHKPANTIKKYENIKGSYERDKDYLATITENGIWIKEKSLNKSNIIPKNPNKNQLNGNIFFKGIFFINGENIPLYKNDKIKSVANKLLYVSAMVIPLITIILISKL